MPVPAATFPLAPQFFMGNGGWVAKQGSPNLGVNVTDWTMEKSIRVADATHSGTQGWALYKGTVKEASGTFKAVWDASSTVEYALSLDIGTECVLLLKVGNSTRKFTAPALIEKLSYQVNNQTGLVTYDASWKNQGPVTGPN